jgi:archaemetzincin
MTKLLLILAASLPLLLACLLLFGGPSRAAGEEPAQDEARAAGDARAPEAPRAKGDTKAPEAAFADTEGFKPMPKPKPGDWLSRFKEPGQSFKEYLRSRPVRRTKKRFRIVLQPMGPFSRKERDLLQKLKAFTAIYFDSDVSVTTPIELPKKGKRTRKWGKKKWAQYHSEHILDEVLPPRLPSDALCYLGITMGDLYPEASWNYVFGQASLQARVGVYSLVRYFPEFWGEERTPAAERLGLLRSMKVLAHETGHMFTLAHCTAFLCVMNGSNHLEESDRQPLWLCPVCLKKLQWNLGFPVIERYEKLRAFCRENGLAEEAQWYKKRIERIRKVEKKK